MEILFYINLLYTAGLVDNTFKWPIAVRDNIIAVSGLSSMDLITCNKKARLHRIISILVPYFFYPLKGRNIIIRLKFNTNDTERRPQHTISRYKEENSIVIILYTKRDLKNTLLRLYTPS